jgi:hypothetical protein
MKPFTLDKVRYVEGKVMRAEHINGLRELSRKFALLRDIAVQLNAKNDQLIKDKKREKSLVKKYRASFENCKRNLELFAKKNKALKNLAIMGKTYKGYCGSLVEIGNRMKGCLDGIETSQHKIDELEGDLLETEHQFEAIDKTDKKNMGNLELIKQLASEMCALNQQIDTCNQTIEKNIQEYTKLKEEFIHTNPDTAHSMGTILKQMEEFDAITKKEHCRSIDVAMLTNNLNELIGENICKTDNLDSDQDTESEDEVGIDDTESEDEVGIDDADYYNDPNEDSLSEPDAESPTDSPHADDIGSANTNVTLNDASPSVNALRAELLRVEAEKQFMLREDHGIEIETVADLVNNLNV